MKIIFYLFNYLRIHIILLYTLILWQLALVKIGSNLSLDQYSVIFSLSLVCAFVYIHNKYTDKVEDEEVSNVALQSVSHCLGFITLIIGLLLSLSQSVYFFIFCTCIAFIGYLYNQGLQFKNFSIPRFKKVFIIKTLVASLSWYGTIIGSLYFMGGYNGKLVAIAIQQLYLLFLFAAFEIWWDIRDVEGDKKNKIKTLPVVFGILPSYLILIVFITVSIFLKIRYSISFEKITAYLPFIVGVFITTRYKIGYHLTVYGFIIFILLQVFLNSLV